MGLRRAYRLLLMAVWTAGAGALALERGGMAAWFVVWMLGGVWLLSLSAHLFQLVQVKAERTLQSEMLSPGEALLAELTIRHTSLLPLPWVAVTDRWIRLADGEEFQVTRLAYPGFSRRFKIRYRLSGLGRGEYRFIGTELLTGDLWGMAIKRRLAASDGGFAVFPQARQLVPSLVPHGRGTGEVGLFFRYGVGVPGSTVRSYVRGDPLRNIHWKSTARAGEMMTRTDEFPEELRFVLFLDASASAYQGGRGSELFEAGIEWSAGLLQAAYEARAEAGIYAGGKKELWLPPAARHDWSAVLRRLAGLQADGEEAFCEQLEGRAQHLVRAPYTIIAVTAGLQEELVRAIRRLRNDGREVVLIHLQASPILPAAERERRTRLKLAGCPVIPVSPGETERRLVVHAEWEAGA